VRTALDLERGMRMLGQIQDGPPTPGGSDEDDQAPP
jgi:hypothetical protein